jgi:hypothetical protein
MDKASVSWFALGRFDLQGLRTEAQRILVKQSESERARDIQTSDCAAMRHVVTITNIVSSIRLPVHFVTSEH